MVWGKNNRASGSGNRAQSRSAPHPRKITRIRIKNVLRSTEHDDLDEDVVNSIAESLVRSEAGPIHPIVVRRIEGDQVALVAGAHRLEAAGRAGQLDIECVFFEGDDNEARILQIEENIFRKNLSVLRESELLSEWAELTEKQRLVFGQVGQKTMNRGRPQGGILRLARETPTIGRSLDARRKIIGRAKKIARICASAKDIARETGLDRQQRALLEIAEAGGPSAQIRKAEKLRERYSQQLVAKEKQAPALAKKRTKPKRDQMRGERHTSFEALSKWWNDAGGTELWMYTPFAIRKQFTDKLLRARCAAKTDVVAFIQEVFRGREKIESRALIASAKAKGISKASLRKHLNGLGYKKRKRGRQPNQRTFRINANKNWRGELPSVSDAVLSAALEPRVVREKNHPNRPVDEYFDI